MSDRITSIDIAKAICILLVVIGHYVPTDAPAWYKSMVEVIYGFHMPLFMFVSGYVYWKGATRKPVKYPDFILKKFNRLMIPYFLVSVLIISIKMVMGKNIYLENPVTWTTFLSMFYIPSAGYFLWFVYVLFLIFLIIPFFHTDKRLNLLFVASLIWLVVPISVIDWFCLAQWKSHLFYFVLGCVISREEKKRLFTVKMPLLLKAAVYAGFYSLLFCLSKNVFPELSSETIRPFTYLFFALAGIG
ncbi:MAG: acyltransferase family protein, partial [Tannerella sp.]|nr:acyltransferase family protein [Tannerella sp.]